MTKKFFLKASPKAARGIRRLYEMLGAEVHVMLDNDGTTTVVVIMPDNTRRKKPSYAAA